MATEELNQGETRTIGFVPNGDLYIILPDRRLLVSAAILSLCSPVFATMLASGFREGLKNNPGEKSHVSLPEDGPEAFTKICQIVHHEVEKFPKQMTADEMKAVALLSNKYDCARIARPWVKSYFNKELGKIR